MLLPVYQDKSTGKIEVKCLEDYKYMATDRYITTESTSKVHGHWSVKYAVANIQDRGK